MKRQRKVPPKIAVWMLRHMADPEDKLSLLGDFEEEYTDLCFERGIAKANSWYWLQILISIPSFFKSLVYWRLTMLKNYLMIALRNIKKHKTFSFINITGLAVGIACCVMILLWVQDELSYDRFHENHKELYRTIMNHEGEWWSSTPWALAPLLKREYPEILKSKRYANRNMLITYKENSFYESMAFVDPDFFEMFTFPVVKGDSQSALATLDSVVITESAAKKYFGTEDPMGKALTANNRRKLTVTGIMIDMPTNSHMSFSMLAPVRLFGEETLSSWAVESNSYVLLQKNTSQDSFRKKISGIIMEYDKRTTKTNIADIQPITRIHLYSLNGRGNIFYVYIFSTIAVFVLFVACINFMNLSTARAGTRAKEVGIRKVIGARRSHVIKQFFGESILFAFIAMLLSLVLVYLLLPVFNNLAQKSLALNPGQNFTILFGLLGVTLFTGFVSGSYPALFLSTFLPVNVLKGKLPSSKKRSFLRRALVVTQFAVAIILIIGTFILYKQLNYIRNKELGFNRQHVISLPMNRAVSENFQAFKNEIVQNPQVVHVTSATSRPTRVGNINPVYWEGRGPDQYETMRFVAMEYDYINTFEMEIVEGRDFSREYPTDSQNYIVNEAAVKFMGLKEPLGKLFSIWQDEGKIIGVVKDFHSRPLHEEIEPLVLTLTQNWSHNFIFIRMLPDNISQTMGYLEGAWKKFSPNYPFDYLFLDEAFEQLYRTDQRTGIIFKYFSILAIFISCLGIFGMAAYMIEQRTKEIGVRKVLGASVSNIVALVSKEFVILLALANGIAWPLAYLLMNKTLNNYAYRTNITFWIFLLAGVLASAIALLTVSFHAFKAARTEPVNALRYE